MVVFEVFSAIFNSVYVWLIALLPNSPFQAFIHAIDEIPYLAEFNWFFPVSEVIVVMQGFLSVVLVYYTYQAIMRFIHLIG